jgi:hypothetical protein
MSNTFYSYLLLPNLHFSQSFCFDYIAVLLAFHNTSLLKWLCLLGHRYLSANFFVSSFLNSGHLLMPKIKKISEESQFKIPKSIRKQTEFRFHTNLVRKKKETLEVI